MSSDSDGDVVSVLEASFLSVLRPAVLAQLARELAITEVPARRVIFDYELSIIVAGRFRAYITDPAGRQLTVGYLSASSAIGLAHVAGRRYPTAFQSLSTGTLLRIGDARFAQMLAVHPELGWTAATEIASRLDDIEAELARVAFGSLRQRIAYHLLALSGERNEAVHQAQLAAAVGSVREVVARSLAQLRTDGLIDVGPGGATVADRPTLARLADT